MKLPRYIIWIAFVVIVCIVVGIITFNAYKSSSPTNEKTSNTKVEDAEKFKKEYEELNNKEIDNHKLIELAIDKNNPIYYASLNDIKKIQNGVILIGSPKDPNTRNLIPILFSVADSRSLNTIYYLETTDSNKKELNTIYNIETKDTDLLIIKDSKLIYQSKGLGIKVEDKYKALSDNNKEKLASILGNKIDEINPGVCDESC